MCDIHLGSYKVSSIHCRPKTGLLVKTEMTSWAGGYEPYSIFYLGILKVGFSPALNTVLCVSAHQCSARD